MRSVENNTQISPLKLFLLQAKPYVSLVNKSPPLLILVVINYAH